MSEVYTLAQESLPIQDQQDEREAGPVFVAEPADEEFDWPVGSKDRGPTFREMLESLNDPIPTFDELEVRSHLPVSLSARSALES